MFDPLETLQCTEIAEKLRALFDCLRAAGFDEEQSMRLLTTMLMSSQSS